MHVNERSLCKKNALKEKKIEAMHVHERGVGTPKCALRQLPQVRDVYCVHYHGLLQEYLAVEKEKEENKKKIDNNTNK